MGDLYHIDADGLQVSICDARVETTVSSLYIAA